MSLSLSSVNQNGLVKDKIDQDLNIGNLRTIFAPHFINTNPYQKQLAEYLDNLGVEVDGLSYRKVFLPTATKKGKVNIFHLHWLHTFSKAPNTITALLRVTKFISGLVILRLMGIKIVWTAHNLKDHENQRQFLDRICTFTVAKLAHAIITHCQAAKWEVIKELNLTNKNKVFAMPHGNYNTYYENKIDQTEARKLLGLSDSSTVFLFLGLIRPYKGVFELIESFQQLPKDGLELVIAGKTLNDELTEQVKQKIEGFDNIKFRPGFVPDDQIQVYMNASDAVIFPYKNVLTSGTVILAMSFGKACIAPRRGCIGEILHESGAFLYNPDQEEGLLEAMNSALHKKTALSNMGQYNQQLANQWSWELVARETLDVYKQCLSR